MLPSFNYLGRTGAGLMAAGYPESAGMPQLSTHCRPDCLRDGDVVWCGRAVASMKLTAGTRIVDDPDELTFQVGREGVLGAGDQRL